MVKSYLTIIFCLFGLAFSCCEANSEILKASIADSTGVVGLDMRVGVEPVPIIRNVFKDTPAYSAGLLPGDRIVSINNVKTYGMNSAEVDYAIPDIPGKTVNLTIIRNNNLLTFNLTVVPLHLISETTQKVYESF